MLMFESFASVPARALEATSPRGSYAIVVPAAMTQIVNAPSLQLSPNIAVSTFAGCPNADYMGAKLVYGLLPSSGLLPLSHMTAFFLKTQIVPSLYKRLTIEYKSTVRLAGLTFEKWCSMAGAMESRVLSWDSLILRMTALGRWR